MKKKVFILGFGRSGTTWICDIVSKASGTLVLFEPFHPSVTEASREVSYAPVCENGASLKEYLNNVMGKRHRKMWLMRNHVPVRLEEISPNFLELIWENCRIRGFKEIRANFMLSWLHNNFDAKIVYIIRHPCAVVSSILKRQNFWEFGWPGTYELFLARTVYNDHYKTHRIARCLPVVEHAKTDFERIAVMWAVTHAVTLPELKELNLPLFYYEDFYAQPFPAVKELMAYLEMPEIDLHPAHIFTPSMTTLKTLHGLYGMDKSVSREGASLFWRGVLDEREVGTVLDIVRYFGIELYNETGFPVKEGFTGGEGWDSIPMPGQFPGPSGHEIFRS